MKKNRMTKEMRENISKVLNAVQNPVYFRSIMYEYLGSREAADLLLQIHFWWNWKGQKEGSGRPFFKFNAPCGNPLYKIGDSWEEEIALTRTKLDSAKKLISTSTNGYKTAMEVLSKNKDNKNLVAYFTDQQHITWYFLNEDLFFSTVLKAIKNREETNKKLAKKFNKPLGRGISVNEDYNGDTAELKPASMTQDSCVGNNSDTQQIHITNQESENDVIENFNEFFDENATDVKVEPKEDRYKPPVDPVIFSKQQQMAEVSRLGSEMTLAFSVDTSIILEALDVGYDEEDIQTQLSRYKHYYTQGKGKTKKAIDWNRHFIDFWLNVSYEKGNIKRNGERKKIEGSTGFNEGISRGSELRRKAESIFTEDTESYSYAENADRIRELRKG